MTDTQRSNPEHDCDRREPSSAELLRRAADDELTRPQRALLEAHLTAHPTDIARVQFERELKKHVRAAMAPAEAPQALRDAVRAILASAPSEEQPADAPTPIRRPSRSYWARLPWGPLAVAAALLLAVSAAVIVQRAGSTEVWLSGERQATVVSFVGKEHSRCAAMACGENPKWTARNLDETRSLLQKVLGGAPERLDLAGVGYTLTGAGHCHVPGAGKSVHLLYRSAARLDAPAISLFVQQNPEVNPADTTCLKGLVDSGEVLIWRRDGLIFYLMASDSSDANEALAALGGPTKQHRI